MEPAASAPETVSLTSAADGAAVTGRLESAALGVDAIAVLRIRPDRYIGGRRDGGDTAGDASLTDYFATLSS